MQEATRSRPAGASKKWIGVLECWSVGVLECWRRRPPITPLLHHSTKKRRTPKHPPFLRDYAPRLLERVGRDLDGLLAFLVAHGAFGRAVLAAFADGFVDFAGLRAGDGVGDGLAVRALDLDDGLAL